MLPVIFTARGTNSALRHLLLRICRASRPDPGQAFFLHEHFIVVLAILGWQIAHIILSRKQGSNGLRRQFSCCILIEAKPYAAYMRVILQKLCQRQWERCFRNVLPWLIYAGEGKIAALLTSCPLLRRSSIKERQSMALSNTYNVLRPGQETENEYRLSLPSHSRIKVQWVSLLLSMAYRGAFF